MHDIDQLRKELAGAVAINETILETIYSRKWLKIWVPQKYNGLGCNLVQGLETLQHLATVDGSLGWFVTLCSGANYFSRNLEPETAQLIFQTPNVCLGGSGHLGGTAEKQEDAYLINGLWHYATGAPHLSHFTLNAQIIEGGRALTDENGQPVFLSFVLDAEQVQLIPSWETMGMVATASHSFEVINQLVPFKKAFVYNKFYGDGTLDKIPFSVFADFTLLVNYLGMAKHFADASLEIATYQCQYELLDYLSVKTQEVYHMAAECEQLLSGQGVLDEFFICSVHTLGESIVTDLITKIMEVYPLLGIKVSRRHETINQVFRDFFTATQHKNFRKQDL